MDYQRVLALFRALQDQNVEYILVGAVALTVHGIVRATQDIDLFVRAEDQNIARLRGALRSLFPDDASIEQITAQDLAGEYPVIRYNSPDGSLQIDFVARLGPAFAYDDLGFEEKLYESIPVRVATPKTLFDMKKSTVRLQDSADAEMLKNEFDLED